MKTLEELRKANEKPTYVIVETADGKEIGLFTLFDEYVGHGNDYPEGLLGVAWGRIYATQAIISTARGNNSDRMVIHPYDLLLEGIRAGFWAARTHPELSMREGLVNSAKEDQKPMKNPLVG